MTYLQPAPLTHVSASVAIPHGSDGWTGSIVAAAATRTGQWVAIARATPVGPSCGARIVDASGTVIGTFNGYFWHLDNSGAINGSPSSGDFWQGFLNNGQSLFAQAATGSFGSGTLYLDLFFIPVPGNRA